MADYDIDQINSAFAQFRAATRPSVVPPGFDQARKTARRRRTAAATVATVVIVLAVATGAVASGRLSSQSGSPGSPTLSAIPTATRSYRTPPGPAPALVCPSTKNTPGRPGDLEPTDLCDATLEIPTVGGPTHQPDATDRCPGGPLKFSGGRHRIDGNALTGFNDVVLSIGEGPSGVAAVDLDHDGTNEVVVMVTCGGVKWDNRVVAFKRGPDGSIRTLGTVLAAHAVPVNWYLATTPDGVVWVDVADILSGPADTPGVAQDQWRGYAWQDGRFVQVDGPTSFPVNPRVTDLAVSATPLVFDPPVGGIRHGSTTLTVRNLGPSSIPFTLQFVAPGPATLALPTGCKQTQTGVILAVVCSADGLTPGTSRAFPIGFEVPEAAQLDQRLKPNARVFVSRDYGDTNDGNDVVQFDMIVK
jgi:hypothetical protein